MRKHLTETADNAADEILETADEVLENGGIFLKVVITISSTSRFVSADAFLKKKKLSVLFLNVKLNYFTCRLPVSRNSCKFPKNNTEIKQTRFLIQNPDGSTYTIEIYRSTSLHLCESVK